MRVQLQREQKLKAQAVEKLEHLRRELNLEAPSALSSPAGGEEFWKRRVVDAQKRVEVRSVYEASVMQIFFMPVAVMLIDIKFAC